MRLPKLPAELPIKPFIFDDLITRKPISLKSHIGQVILIVNTASHCGLAYQFKKLEKLLQTFQHQAFTIIAVPSNDFGNQEIPDEHEISNMYRNQFGGTCIVTQKYSVIGNQSHPFYRWANDQVGILGCPKWNFHKYLINRQGQLINYFHSTTCPLSRRIIHAVDKALQAS